MKYYGVIGNRDHIKYHGEKRPFWEFLDEQPYGYLTSLVYKRKDLPDSPMIFDCGAWSYRNDEMPKITPELALSQYLELAKPGAMLISPDHMLIPGVDLNVRRTFNLESASRFIKICPPEFLPMATSHGMDLEERIKHTIDLSELGYRHIAIGGVAARAAQKKLVLSMIKELRQSVPDVWLHVLGLSSPPYVKAWVDMGIDSCDGSSHFKQAFTGGAFFTIENGKLKKWQASRPTRGERPTAPLCNCTACFKLREEEGIDTRTYGSNENNMGRAAHNMNMLMKAHKIAINGTTVLVSCVGKKTSTPQKAKDLYQSSWFIKARKWAENNGDRWFILSALHGLIDPEKIIEPYEKTLNKIPTTERAEWSANIHNTIVKTIPKGRIVFLAGQKYRDGLELTLSGAGYVVESPMQGMGIGQQLSWLNKNKGETQCSLF
jgi:hypothetical protein